MCFKTDCELRAEHQICLDANERNESSTFKLPSAAHLLQRYAKKESESRRQASLVYHCTNYIVTFNIVTTSTM